MKTVIFSIVSLAAILEIGCAPAGSLQPQLLLGPGPLDQINVKDLVNDNPVGPQQALRAILAGKTATSSYHVVQIRTQEQPHIHATHDLVAHMLKGYGRIYLASSNIDAELTASMRRIRKGDTIVIPRGTVHWFVNESSSPAVALATFSPPMTEKDVVPTPRFLPLQSVQEAGRIDPIHQESITRTATGNTRSMKVGKPAPFAGLENTAK